MALTAGSIEIKIFASLARLQSDMTKANKTVDAAMRNIDKSVSMAKAAFGGLVGSVTLGAFVKLADEYKRFDSQLQLSTRNLNEYNEAYKNVVRISNQSQSDIGALGVFYARLNNNLKDLNVTQQQVSDVAETVAFTLRANNATVQETSSVMLQLSQSFGSGRLNGQEFLAVAEGAPMLLRQLANSMKVPFGALKELAAQGKITREELLKAFSDPEYKKAVEANVAQVGTISSAMTVFINNLKLFIGEQDKATGTSRAIASVIKALAENINVLATGALVLLISRFGLLISGIYASIQASRRRQIELTKETVLLKRKAAAEAEAAMAMQMAMANNARATTMWAARNSALMSETAALNAAVTARTTALGTASAVASRGLAMLGGPIGAITTLLTLGATAWMVWGNSARSSAEGVAAIIDRINRGIASINDVKVLEIEKKALEAERRSLENKRKILQAFDPGRGGGAGIFFDPTGKETSNETVMRNAKLEEYARRIKELDDAIAKYGQTQKENSVIVTEADKAYQRLADASLLASLEIQKQKGIIADAKLALEAGKIKQYEYNEIVKDAQKKMDDATGATERAKEALKRHNEVIDQAIDLAKQHKREYDEFIKAQEKARESAVGNNDELIKEIEKRREAIDILLNGEDAYRMLEIARLEEALATSEQIVAQGQLNGLNGAALDFAKEYIEKLREEIELKKQIRDLDANQKNLEKAKKDDAAEQKKDLQDQKRLAKELQMTFTSAFEDAISRGKGFREVLAGIEQDIIRIVTRRLVTQPFADWISGQMDNMDMGNIFGSFPMGSAGTGSGLLGWVSKFLPSFDVGSAYVPRDMMANVHKGERILTAEENRAYMEGSNRSIVVNNNFTVSGNMDTRTQSQIAASVYSGINRAARRNL